MEVLIAADDPKIISLLEAELHSRDVSVHSSSTLAEVGKLLKERAPAVVLLDEESFLEAQGLIEKMSSPEKKKMVSRCTGLILLQKRYNERKLSNCLQVRTIQKTENALPFILSACMELLQELRHLEKMRKSKEGSRRRERKYRFFFAHMPIAAVVSDSNYIINEWNLEAERLFGYRREEVVGKNLIDLLYSEGNEDSPHSLQENLLSTLISEERSKNVNYDRTEDGRHILCEWFDLPYSSGGEEYILSVAKDITKEKEMLDTLSTTVKQKDLLMQEIHHRLKNNLTMITSLINIRMEDEQKVDALQDIHGKIQAVSEMYEKLYSKGETSKIEISSYLEDLLYSLFTTLAEGQFSIEVHIEEMNVEPETAIALGLITNEIATNAIKHGFLPDKEAIFTIETEYSREEGCYIFMFKNSGRPFPETLNIASSTNTGLQLIETLVLQLEGKIELIKRPSTQYRISIPAEKVR